MKHTAVLTEAIITEKTLRLANRDNVYTFAVDRFATKHQIKNVVQKQFNVSVVKIRTINLPGKLKRRGASRPRPTLLPGKKKALVQLKPTDKIKLFEVSS